MAKFSYCKESGKACKEIKASGPPEVIQLAAQVAREEKIKAVKRVAKKRKK